MTPEGQVTDSVTHGSLRVTQLVLLATTNQHGKVQLVAACRQAPRSGQRRQMPFIDHIANNLHMTSSAVATAPSNTDIVPKYTRDNSELMSDA